MKKKENNVVVSRNSAGNQKIKQAAVVLTALAVIVSAGPLTGCQPREVSHSTSTILDGCVPNYDIKQQWDQTVEEKLQQINAWYKENIMSDVTFDCLLEASNNVNNSCSPCVVKNGLPEYPIAESLIEIPNLIGDLKEKLCSYDVSRITTEDKIPIIINSICSEYGFFINNQGQLYFENDAIPKFDAGSKENPTITAVGGDDFCCFYSDDNLFYVNKNTNTYNAYSFYGQKVDGTSVAAPRYISDLEMGEDPSSMWPCNILYICCDLRDYNAVNITKNGENGEKELDIIGVDLVDILAGLERAGLHEVNMDEYNKLCQDAFKKRCDFKRVGIEPYSEYKQQENNEKDDNKVLTLHYN